MPVVHRPELFPRRAGILTALLASTALTAAPNAAIAATVHWNGATIVGGQEEDDWANSALWAGNVAPVDNDDVIIDVGTPLPTMPVLTGGTLTLNDLYVGDQYAGRARFVGVDLAITGNFVVGGNNGVGVVTVDGGAFAGGILASGNNGNGLVILDNGAQATWTYVELGAMTMANGILQVANGSSLDVAADLVVGDLGGGSFEVSGGSTVTSQRGYVGRLYGTGSPSVAAVRDNGSSWTTTDLTIGDSGSGYMYVFGSGYLDADVLVLGKAGTGTGTLIVSGNGSLARAGTDLAVGEQGYGELRILDGGSVFAQSAGIGLSSSSVGLAIVQNPGSVLQVATVLQVGDHGAADLVVADGGTVFAGGEITIGSAAVVTVGGLQGTSALVPGSLLTPGIHIEQGGQLVFNHTGDVDVQAQLSGLGTIKQFAGRTVLSGDSSGAGGFFGDIDVAGGRLAVNGKLAGGITTVSGGTLGGSGTIFDALIDSGTLAPGNSVGVLTANAVTFNPGSTYEVEIDDSGNSDRLDAQSATINGGAVKVVLAPGAIEQQYTILTAANGLTGTFDPAVDTPFLYSAALSYDANAVYLTLAGNGLSLADAGQTPNQKAAGAGAMGTALFSELAALTAAELPAALDGISGEAHPSYATALLEQSHLVRGAALGRLDQGFDALGPTSDLARNYAAAPLASTQPPAGTALWGDIYGGYLHLNGDGNAAAINSSAGGLVLGADGELGDGRLGGLVDAGLSSFSVPDRDSSADSTDIGAGVYAGMQWGATRLKLGATFTRHQISSTRSVTVGRGDQTLTAGYGAGTSQVFAELSQKFEFGALGFTPFGDIAYVHQATDAFTEQGGDAAVSAAAGVIDATFTTLGARASQDVAFGDKLATFAASLGWRHAFGDAPVGVNSFAGGAPFTVAGAPLNRDALVLGAGVAVDLSAQASLAVTYDGQLASSGQAHAVRLTFSAQF